MNKWIKWGGGAVVVLVILAKLGSGGDTTPPASAPAADAPAAAPAEPTAAPKGVTLAQFEAIQTGATFEDVVAAIGEPKATMSESEIAGHKSAMYQWEGAGFASSMTAMFTDGTLTTKAQMGLK